MSQEVPIDVFAWSEVGVDGSVVLVLKLIFVIGRIAVFARHGHRHRGTIFVRMSAALDELVD